MIAVLLVVIGALPQSWAETDEGTCRYAEQLMRDGDYYRAIGEFKRLRFFSTESVYQGKAALEMGRCYLLAGRDSEAEEVLSSLAGVQNRGPRSDSARLCLGLSQFRLGEFCAARTSWRAVVGTLNCPQSKQAEASILGSYLWEDDAPSGRCAAKEFGMDSSFEATLRMRPARRSIGLAIVLSSLVPGAGQAYGGRPVDGLVSLAVEAATVWLFYRSLRTRNPLSIGANAFIGAGFYLGGIYGAAVAARLHNDRAELAYRKLLVPYFPRP